MARPANPSCSARSVHVRRWHPPVTKSKTWASIDGNGDESAGPDRLIAQSGKRLFALPAKRGSR